MSALIILILI